MTEFPKNFEPRDAEDRIYARWRELGLFKPEINPGGTPYTIVIPPPNVTGQLHMGHALNSTIQDALVRWRRMHGDAALWIPGTDHAGIATQNVVERKLAAEGANRHEIGREAFIEKVWQWREEYGGRIIHQLHKLGCSCDWDRERFTMDEGLSHAVREVFVRLHGEGLIYRAKRLVNWCPRCRTALSDLEVEHEDMEGLLTYINYQLKDGRGHLTVATTRPETMLGDTAVAVNPKDERYAHLIGHMLELPLTGRLIPIVADTAVDPAFGTGAVKVTPGHDFNDEAIAQRQSPPLPSITIIGEDGTMTVEAGHQFKGMDRYECRKLVVSELERMGHLVKQDKHAHSVGHCYRCKTVCEPYATPQWFVRVGPLAEQALEVVRDGRIRILPEGWKNSYYSWMENIKDWCITRQIWWGHRVPVWYCDDCGEITVPSVDDPHTDPASCTKCAGKNIRQDPDVLDTWFSSALWPFSTLGWPEKTRLLGSHYPTNVLVTAFDILFFWVARMIMMGMKFMDEVPFRDVYIHALVRDEDGQKMSKSKGNVIDPLIMIEKFGTDAFRFTLAAFAAQGRDVRFSEERVLGYKNFINKLWNATRFIMMNLGEEHVAVSEDELRALAMNHRIDSLASLWILKRLSRTIVEVEDGLRDYRFNDAASAVYQFTWHEFCDWYIEMAKVEMSEGTKYVLLYALDNILRLLHPFMPFVTEELWRGIPIKRSKPSIMVAQFPVAFEINAETEAGMGIVLDAINSIRNIRGEQDVSPKEVLDVTIRATEAATLILKDNMHLLERLARASVKVSPDAVKPEGAYTSVKEHMEVYVVINISEIDIEAELAKLEKESAKIEVSMLQVSRKLENDDFIARAPKEVVEKERAKYAELKGKLDKLQENAGLLRGKK